MRKIKKSNRANKNRQGNAVILLSQYGVQAFAMGEARKVFGIKHNWSSPEYMQKIRKVEGARAGS